MIIDGEELRMQCKQCGTKYKHIIGYGPICPNEWLRQESLRKHPPHCPNCGSSNYRRLSLWGRILDLFSRSIPLGRRQHYARVSFFRSNVFGSVWQQWLTEKYDLL